MKTTLVACKADIEVWAVYNAEFDGYELCYDRDGYEFLGVTVNTLTEAQEIGKSLLNERMKYD